MDSNDKLKDAEDISKKAKEEAHDGNFIESLKLFKEAFEICPTDKLKRRIEKIEELITATAGSSGDDEDDPNMVDMGKNFFLHKSIALKLYEYQKKGVLWFWKLFHRKQGGILGDDMGLGKTIQVIAFLAGMFDAELIKHVIIVGPVAVLVNWEKELTKWAGGIRVKLFHGSNKKTRLKNLHKIQANDGIILTTYGMCVSSVEALSEDENGHSFNWDYIILDEGHKIRNPTKTSKCVRAIPAKYHYILTGTPIQNNLSELWSLFDFTQQGRLLGTRKTFKTEFENPIVRAREKDATSFQQEVGNNIAGSLREMIAPYFLRRTKKEVFQQDEKESEKSEENEEDNVGKKKEKQEQAKLKKLTARKEDLVVWVYLSELQLRLYRGFINSERVKQTLMSTRSPLAELNLLKKISDHPRLQSTLSKLLTSSEEHETRLTCGIEHPAGEGEEEIEAHDAPPVKQLIEDSGKMVFLVYLMEELRQHKHRTVIFSQSRKMLDIIQKVLNSLDHKILRIDGKMTNPQDREKVQDKFRDDISYNVMLMTTQVGSVGITLTCADRLIVFDPSWNPGTDAQAVDRVYRIGQERDVVVYRLITCGSIEEKIYRKQIFKNAVMKQTTGASDNPYRYFTNHELRELFVLEDPTFSTTQQQLEQMHPYETTPDNLHFERHLQFLSKRKSVYGVSHHKMLFSEEASNEGVAQHITEEVQLKVDLAKKLVMGEYNQLEIKPRTKKTSSSSSQTSTESSPDKTKRTKPIAEEEGINISIEIKSPPTNLQINASFKPPSTHEDSNTPFEELTQGEEASPSYVSINDNDDSDNAIANLTQNLTNINIKHTDEEKDAQSQEECRELVVLEDSRDVEESLCEVADAGCSPMGDQSCVVTPAVSVYEVADVSCSPIRINSGENEGTMLEVADVSCSPMPQESSQEVFVCQQRQNQISEAQGGIIGFATTEGTVQRWVFSNHVAAKVRADMEEEIGLSKTPSKPKELQNFLSTNSDPMQTSSCDGESNEISQDSYLESSFVEKEAGAINQKLFNALGRNYRTPPVSPMCKPTLRQQNNDRRLASTPVVDVIQNKASLTRTIDHEQSNFSNSNESVLQNVTQQCASIAEEEVEKSFNEESVDGDESVLVRKKNKKWHVIDESTDTSVHQNDQSSLSNTNVSVDENEVSRSLSKDDSEKKIVPQTEQSLANEQSSANEQLIVNEQSNASNLSIEHEQSINDEQSINEQSINEQSIEHKNFVANEQSVNNEHSRDTEHIIEHEQSIDNSNDRFVTDDSSETSDDEIDDDDGNRSNKSIGCKDESYETNVTKQIDFNKESNIEESTSELSDKVIAEKLDDATVNSEEKTQPLTCGKQMRQELAMLKVAQYATSSPEESKEEEEEEKTSELTSSSVEEVFDFDRPKREMEKRRSTQLINQLKLSVSSRDSPETAFDFEMGCSPKVEQKEKGTSDDEELKMLHLLRNLMKQNMGNLNIDDHSIIKIASLVKQLNLM